MTGARPAVPGIRLRAVRVLRQPFRVIELRVLTPDDWRAWRDLRLAALGEAAYAFGSRLSDWQGNGDREERWRSRLSIPGSRNIIAVLDGQPAGMVSGVPSEDEPGAAELISMWVSPAARGRGVGDRLISAVEDWARQAGAGVLKLAVSDGNKHAMSLYRRSGFADTGQTGDLMADGVRRERIMAKTLGARI
jgi:ribosomal protein S18 acetylase RimI-like enzyme